MGEQGGKVVRFTLIGVPSSAGTHGVGLEKAPLQLRRAGLVDRLLDAGLDVVDDGDLPLALYRPRSPDRTQQNLDQVVAVAGRVADRVAHTVATGRIPLVLGGDCTITLGVVAGLLRHHPGLGVLYFDGDVDLSTPATTQSGILDAMGWRICSATERQPWPALARGTRCCQPSGCCCSASTRSRWAPTPWMK
jgi:arginase